MALKPKRTIKHTTKVKKSLKNDISEHSIQKQIVTYLRLLGFLVICTDVMAALGYITGNKRFAFIRHYKDIGYTKGTPDIVIIKNGYVAFIEVKKQSGKQSVEQKEIEKIIKSHKFEYYVIRSLEDAKHIFG